MKFLRVVEVLPPRPPASHSKGAGSAGGDGFEAFAEESLAARPYADIFLVANLPGTRLRPTDTVRPATLLQDRLGVVAAPVLVVRDQTRAQLLSSVYHCFSSGLGSMMLAWGDDLPPVKSRNTREFLSLAAAVRAASLLKSKARSDATLLAPVNLDLLDRPRGIELAKGRIAAGADFLLAQPPTTDPEDTFDRHRSLIEGAGLRGRVLLNVFPFRSPGEVSHYARKFGWSLPDSLRRAAARGEGVLTGLERRVVRRLRDERFPGVYISTRGFPDIARRLLS